MKTLILKPNELPELSDNIKHRVKEGFWSLLKTSTKNGNSNLYIKSEKRIYVLSQTGAIEKIIENNELKEKVVARLNFA